MLTASQLTAMRSTMVGSLAGTAVIQTQSYVSDGGGGGTTTWTNAGTAACRVTPVASAGEGESMQGGRIHPDTEYIITLEAGTVVDDDCQIVTDGETFTATVVREPRTWELSRRVEAKVVN